MWISAVKSYKCLVCISVKISLSLNENDFCWSYTVILIPLPQNGNIFSMLFNSPFFIYKLVSINQTEWGKIVFFLSILLFFFSTCHYSNWNEDMNVKDIIKKERGIKTCRVEDKTIRRERKWSEITMVTEAERRRNRISTILCNTSVCTFT